MAGLFLIWLFGLYFWLRCLSYYYYYYYYYYLLCFVLGIWLNWCVGIYLWCPVKTQMDGMKVLKWVPVSFGYFKDQKKAIDNWVFSFSRSFRRSNMDLFGVCFSICSIYHSFEESGINFKQCMTFLIVCWIHFFPNLLHMVQS